MLFQTSKSIILAVSALLMMLVACTQAPNYAPVKIVNQAIEPNNGYYFRKKIPFKSPNYPGKPVDSQQDNSVRQTLDIDSPPYPGAYQGIPSQNQSETPIIKQKAARPLNAKKIEIKNINQDDSKSTHFSPGIDKIMPPKQQKVAIAAQQAAEHSKKQPIISSTTKIELPKNPKRNTPQVDDNLLISKNNKEKTSIISIDNKKMLKLNFQWPINGKISRNFAQTDGKGIDIRGRTGQAVQATEAGKAVYCGQGLAGFGNLVIIKHNANYLSAYANNSKLYVEEGQQVDKGQTIGQVSSAGLKKGLLHFEIRKNGKPINPLTLMPKH